MMTLSYSEASPVLASGLAALLEEDDLVLRQSALHRLHAVIDQCWSEVSTLVPLIEGLSEDASFPSRELAASVASKIFFHLEEYDDALRLALGAGSYFDVTARTEYVETLISKCVDAYVASCAAQARDASAPALDPRLMDVVGRMFERCFADGQYYQAMGIALEAHRIDKMQDVVTHCPAAQRPALFAYVFEVVHTLSPGSDFRAQAVRSLVTLHEHFEAPDYVFLCRALQYLDAPKEMSVLLLRLADGTPNETLLAYQLAFNIAESEQQKFILDLSAEIAGPSEEAASEVAETVAETATDEAMPALEPVVDRSESVATLVRILDMEGVWCEIQLHFLSSANKTDLSIFKSVKESIDGNRQSVLHSATVVAHGYANAGTTDTSFLRDNLEWMGKASNWAKFTATASIGVVHARHVKDSLTILQPYLPANGQSVSPFSEGGALFALGLIHANKDNGGKSAGVEYLAEALRGAGNSEPLQHGACLGLGVAAMGTGRERIYEELKTVLFFDSAVAGEAAAYGIGLVLLGHGASSQLSQNALSELLAYAHDTQHEKIIRGVALALALVVAGQEREAEPTIEALCRDRDATVRYGGMFAIGLAYAGTGDDGACARLLRVAVSDVSDDVRRAAVTCLGLVLFRTPVKVLELVGLLSESFNPHVRYGACLAVGFACAGTGDAAALAMLTPMVSDAVDFVRQGALVASALVLMQQSEAKCPAVKDFREKISALVKNKYPSTLTKIGAILSAGILDAGGRNCCVALQSSQGVLDVGACAGLALWAQNWYWYPMLHFFSLSLKPTLLVGLNKDLELPSTFEVTCHAAPALFAYPPPLKEKKEAKKERVATAILSTTLKAKVREKAKEHAEKAQSGTTAEMEIAPAVPEEPAVVVVVPVKAPAATSFSVKNPSRVTRQQQPLCVFDEQQRYVPVSRSVPARGVVLLTDTTPELPSEMAAFETKPDSAFEDVCKMPEPFEWSQGPAN